MAGENKISGIDFHRVSAFKRIFHLPQQFLLGRVMRASENAITFLLDPVMEESPKSKEKKTFFFIPTS